MFQAAAMRVRIFIADMQYFSTRDGSVDSLPTHVKRFSSVKDAFGCSLSGLRRQVFPSNLTDFWHSVTGDRASAMAGLRTAPSFSGRGGVTGDRLSLSLPLANRPRTHARRPHSHNPVAIQSHTMHERWADKGQYLDDTRYPRRIWLAVAE